jgi:hypothetical protein
VDGDVLCMGGRLHEESGAQVGGQRVTALGPRDGKRWGRIAIDHDEERRERHANPTAALIVLIVFTALAWGFARLAPGRTGAALERVRTQPGPSFLVGLLIVLLWIPGFIALALLAAVLCITLIGIPVAVVLLLAYPAMLALVGLWGWAVLAALLGGRLAARGGPGPAIDRAAMYGGLAFGGALVVASLLHVTGVLSGLGTFVQVMTWIGFSVGSMLGAGALVRNEFLAGTLNRWWTGRRAPAAPAAAPVAPAAPAVVAPPAPEPVVPPPPPSPPTSFMPPGGPAAPGDPPAGA